MVVFYDHIRFSVLLPGNMCRVLDMGTTLLTNIRTTCISAKVFSSFQVGHSLNLFRVGCSNTPLGLRQRHASLFHNELLNPETKHCLGIILTNYLNSPCRYIDGTCENETRDSHQVASMMPRWVS